MRHVLADLQSFERPSQMLAVSLARQEKAVSWMWQTDRQRCPNLHQVPTATSKGLSESLMARRRQTAPEWPAGIHLRRGTRTPAGQAEQWPCFRAHPGDGVHPRPLAAAR